MVFRWRGREVVHGWDWTKPALLRRGLVYLGPAFERLVPPVEVTVYGAPLRLRGFTRDPKAVRVVRRFFLDLERGTFRPGPATR